MQMAVLHRRTDPQREGSSARALVSERWRACSEAHTEAVSFLAVIAIRDMCAFLALSFLDASR